MIQRTSFPFLRVFLFGTLAALGYRFYLFHPILIQVHPLASSYFHLPTSSHPTSSPRLSTATDVHNTSNAEGSCHKIRHPSGRLTHCEDLTEWFSPEGEVRGLVASCDPGRRGWNTVMGPLRDPNPRGALWLIDPHTELAQELPLLGYPEGKDFHPLGVSIFSSPAEAGSKGDTVFIVNHGRHNSTIEIFLLSAQAAPTLQYLSTLTHPSLVSPNAVIALSPSLLLVSQDHLLTRRLPQPLSSFLPMLESVLSLPGGKVSLLSFDPSSPGETLQVQTAAGLIPFANGLAYSPEHETLAVASSSQARVELYHLPPLPPVSPSQNSSLADAPVPQLPLKWKHAVPLPFAPDNLSFSKAGTLVAAEHPNFPQLIKHSKNAHVSVGSWIVVVPLSNRQVAREAEEADEAGRKGDEWRTVYQTKGGEGEEVLQGTTTAVVEEEGGKMWAVGLYAEGVLSCGMESLAQ